MNKIIIFVVIGLILIIGLSFLYFAIRPQTSKHQPVIKTTITPTILPSTFPSPTIDFSIYDKLPNSEKQKLQTQADENVSNVQNTILDKYPWYNKLPLQDKRYFVYFDPSKPTFIAIIYPQKSSIISINDQITAYQEEIKNRLKSLVSNLDAYNITWEIKPE